MADDVTQRLAAMRGRSEKATEGPWEADGYEGWVAVVPGPDRLVLEGVTSWREADAEFIAHARTDVDDLLAVVEDVLALCDRADSKPGPDGERHVNTVVLRAVTNRLGGA